MTEPAKGMGAVKEWAIEIVRDYGRAKEGSVTWDIHVGKISEALLRFHQPAGKVTAEMVERGIRKMYVVLPGGTLDSFSVFGIPSWCESFAASLTSQLGTQGERPLPIVITCPKCKTQHVDKEEWATKHFLPVSPDELHPFYEVPTNAIRGGAAAPAPKHEFHREEITPKEPAAQPSTESAFKVSAPSKTDLTQWEDVSGEEATRRLANQVKFIIELRERAEQAEARLSEVSSTEWKDATKELPPVQSGEVTPIFYDVVRAARERPRAMAQYFKNLRGESNWFDDQDIPLDRVTHWRELPEPPRSLSAPQSTQGEK